jgi:hypothetical protein
VKHLGDCAVVAEPLARLAAQRERQRVHDERPASARRGYAHRVLVLAGAVTLGGCAVALMAFATMHALPSGLSPVRDPVSRYGISRLRLGYRVMTIGMAIAGVGALIGVERVLGARARVAVAGLAVFAAARAVISWVPMDDPAAGPSTTGRRHGLLAVLTFVALFVAAVRVSTALEGTHTWQSAGDAFTALDVVLGAALVAMAASRHSPALRSRFGLVERGYYLGAFAWLALVGTLLVTA